MKTPLASLITSIFWGGGSPNLSSPWVWRRPRPLPSEASRRRCIDRGNPKTPLCNSALYQLLEAYYEDVKAVWEERFQKTYGFWRGFADTVVAKIQAIDGVESTDTHIVIE